MSKISLCPTCNDNEIIIAEEYPFYLESIDDYAQKNKINIEKSDKTIDELKKELEIKDKYIKQMIGFIKNDNKIRILLK